MDIRLVQGTTSPSIVHQGVHESDIPPLQTTIEKTDSEQKFVILSDWESALKGISNRSTMNNTSHITQMLKSKTKRLESRGKNPILLDPGALLS
jgi:hypothetical protein